MPRCCTLSLGCGRVRLCSSRWFLEFAQQMRAYDGAMGPSGVTVVCVHSMGLAFLGEGCSFPVVVGQGVSRAVPPSSRRSPLFRFPLRLSPSRPLPCSGVRAQEGVLRRSDWVWSRVCGLITVMVCLPSGSPVWEIPCGVLLATVGDTFRGSLSVIRSGYNVEMQVVSRVVLSSRE